MDTRLVLLFCLLGVLQSCTEPAEDFSIAERLDQELFSVNDTMQVLELDYSLDPLVLDSLIENRLQTSLCWSDNYFGLKLANGEIVKVNINQECYGGYLCILHAPPPRLALQLNTNGDIMALEFEKMDSIPYTLRDWYLKIERETFQPSLIPQVVIKWQQKTPADIIEKVILACKEGYRLVYQDLADAWFDKTYYQLQQEEMDSITRYAPFNICLHLPIDLQEKYAD